MPSCVVMNLPSVPQSRFPVPTAPRSKPVAQSGQVSPNWFNLGHPSISSATTIRSFRLRAPRFPISGQLTTFAGRRFSRRHRSSLIVRLRRTVYCSSRARRRRACRVRCRTPRDWSLATP
jgi:hypothetical protein